MKYAGENVICQSFKKRLQRDKTRCASFISLSRRSPHTNTSHSAATHCSRKKTPEDRSSGEISLQLITRLELVTSSLPRMRTTTCAISAIRRCFSPTSKIISKRSSIVKQILHLFSATSSIPEDRGFIAAPARTEVRICVGDGTHPPHTV